MQFCWWVIMLYTTTRLHMRTCRRMHVQDAATSKYELISSFFHATLCDFEPFSLFMRGDVNYDECRPAISPMCACYPCLLLPFAFFYLCECRALALPLVFLCSLSSLQVSMVERRLGSFFFGTPGSSFMSSQIHHIQYL